MPRIIVVRHGETDANAQHRYQGHNSSPLNQLGMAQAERLALRLQDEGIETILCSDLKRAWQTAHPIARALGLEVVPDERLREIDVGAWEGLCFEEIRSRYPDLMDDWMADDGHLRMPGGESASDLAMRVQDVIDSLRALDDDQNLLLVSHGGWIQILLCLSLGVAFDRRYQFSLRNASVTILSLYGENTILELYNDVHHLKGSGDAHG